MLHIASIFLEPFIFYEKKNLFITSTPKINKDREENEERRLSFGSNLDFRLIFGLFILI